MIIPFWIVKEIRRVVAEQLACCCNGIADETTLSPPVDAPIDGGPIILYNKTTLEIWGWDGDSWELLNAGGTDTNVANANLTLTGDRSHDLNGFALVFSGLGVGAGYGFNANDNIASAVQLLLQPNLVDLNALESGNLARLLMQSGVFKMGSTLGAYELTTPPPQDFNLSNYALTIDTASGRIYAATKLNSITQEATTPLTITYSGYYIFIGTTGTWSLNAGNSGFIGTIINIKNRGSGNLTVDVSNASSSIYDFSAVASIIIPVGEARTFAFDGNYWNVM